MQNKNNGIATAICYKIHSYSTFGLPLPNWLNCVDLPLNLVLQMYKKVSKCKSQILREHQNLCVDCKGSQVEFYTLITWQWAMTCVITSCSDSLGGNAKTVMVANIGPADYNFDETVTTLR